MQSVQFFIRKIIGLVFIIILYSIIFAVLSPALFDDVLVVIAFLIFYIYMLIEQIYKIEPPADYKVTRGDTIIILMFLILPFLLVLGYYERELLITEFFPLWNSVVVKYISIGFLLLGTIITFSSRIQLGKYGTTVIIIKTDHELITSGIYGYIRHPIYLGAVILYISLGTVIGSFLVTGFTFIGWIFLLRSRINLEEKLLTEKFGEVYTDYMKRTKKLIPYLY